jgi:glucosyl-3-phosphoglycerate synthase
MDLGPLGRTPAGPCVGSCSHENPSSGRKRLRPEPGWSAGAIAPWPRRAHASDFVVADLARAKKAQGMTVSVCLPAQDEEATVGAIVAAIRRQLVDGAGLVDEVLVLDDRSGDRTADRARAAGARVLSSAEVLATYGPCLGKGDAIWRSAWAMTGDVLCWIDADLTDFDPSFVVGLLGPLIESPTVSFVKGFYSRPPRGDSFGGGRVTELVVRPLLSLLRPDIVGFVQPLAGEYAIRREAFASLTIEAGWGVEVGLIADVIDRFGMDAVMQMDLGSRHHKSRDLLGLAAQAAEVAQAILRRSGHAAVDTRPSLVQFDARQDACSVPLITVRRPPLSTLDDAQLPACATLPDGGNARL